MVSIYLVLAESVLGLHLLFILWIVFGAWLTRHQPRLRWVHVGCLVWGILVEVTPWPCPLTLLENWLEGKAGTAPYSGGFLLHYLDKLVYPDISPTFLVVAGVVICAGNLAIDTRGIVMHLRNRKQPLP
ncbi:MAG TPA: DUF2784 domain-containing protein [Verrucomicrobiae bacterium]|jgi:hypothetical protein|nr:DUF2784 domain-containing protein [Verrucomicrobiae bacterium]